MTAGTKYKNTFLLFLFGLVLGALAKIFDLHSKFPGNMFSEFSIWFLFCTAVAVYSASPLRAAINVLVFCIGMLVTYYLTAIWLDTVWGSYYVYGWTVFALCLPVFALFTWFASGKGKLAFMLRIGILMVMTLAQLILFKLRISDFIIIAITAYLLFYKKQYDS